MEESQSGSTHGGAAPVPPGTRVGHVHLKVADIERALGFYRDVLGFRVRQRWGRSAVFLAADDYHHDIALNTWQSLGGRPPPAGTTGLFHVAFLYPDRASLADAVRRVLAAGIALEGAADHGVSEAIYLRDPDGNGVELYRDRPQSEWPVDGAGNLAMGNEPIDLEELLGEPVPGEGRAFSSR
jgi:catechol 2,3-dioxygenase